MAQSSSSGTSRRHGRNDHDTASLTSSRYADAEWEAKEALRQRELEEARARATQMEKTMRWWSDCTANWREKWSKVRNERNKAREESKQLRIRLEATLKDVSTCRRERQDLEAENDRLRLELEQAHMLLLKGTGKSGSNWLPDSGLSGADDREAEEYVLPRHTTDLCHTGGVGRENTDDTDVQEDNCVPVGMSNSETALSDTDPTAVLGPRDPAADGGEDIDRDRDSMLQKVAMLQIRLDEASKSIQIEREEKGALQRALDRLRGDLASETRVPDGGIAGRLSLLRAELERMQAENSAEWRRSETLETEKLVLERENKKLRSELRDATERLERVQRNSAVGRLPLTSSSVEAELREDLADRVKELTELKLAHSKLKKVFQEKSTELAHAARRAEQYEAEVKRLRARVEEVKRELTAAEDEVDAASNSIRKLQRANDDLQEQVETLQVQLEHLHSRFPISSSSYPKNAEDSFYLS